MYSTSTASALSDEPFLQESFPIDLIFPHGGGFPSKVSSTRVALEEDGLAGLVPATDEERHSEGPDTPGLGVLLHHQGNSRHKHVTSLSPSLPLSTPYL